MGRATVRATVLSAWSAACEGARAGLAWSSTSMPATDKATSRSPRRDGRGGGRRGDEAAARRGGRGRLCSVRVPVVGRSDLRRARDAGPHCRGPRLSQVRTTIESSPRAAPTPPLTVSRLSYRYFFDLARSQPRASTGSAPPTQNLVVSPHVHMCGPDHALIVYVRVTQSGGNVTTANETRLWKRVGGGWKNVHFHRSSKL